MIYKNYRVPKPRCAHQRQRVKAHDRLMPLTKEEPIFIGFTFATKSQNRRVFIIHAKSALAADINLRNHVGKDDMVGIVKFQAARLRQLCGKWGKIEYLG